jgi:hypothetical protein
VPTATQTEVDHFMKCPPSGQWFDMRDLGQVVEHAHEAEIKVGEVGPPAARARRLGSSSRRSSRRDQGAWSRSTAIGLVAPAPSKDWNKVKNPKPSSDAQGQGDNLMKTDKDAFDPWNREQVAIFRPLWRVKYLAAHA